ncbi:homeobox protein NANOG-like [Macaca thibetana thibetana]|uniref:homeobox protein NANOG-like n=1 Tax=Macaca thibetana thibetana TaxID=257877 RepID=UPI0021BC4F56|nr:homeobox protein NANOG-like [Macaca thibetana thibetana]
MSMDPAYPQSLPCSEASNCKESSLTPVTCGPEENYPSLQMSSAEMPHTETVSPLPSSMDLLIQDSPDSSTSPKGKKPTSAEKSTAKKEDEVPVKKQKTRTVFSSTQLYVLNDRFQRQKYLSLQQMQELSAILNLSYKQVKTWFQNQRMKSKRRQKNNWPKNSSGVTQKASAPTYPTLYSSYHQGCLVNTTGNLSMWSNQTCSNSAWSNQTQNVHSWSNHSWCTRSWNNQAWNSPFSNCGEESLQSCMQFQPNSPASDLEVALETAGESHNVIQQTTRYFSTPQAIDLFLNDSTNMQPEDT